MEAPKPPEPSFSEAHKDDTKTLAKAIGERKPAAIARTTSPRSAPLTRGGYIESRGRSLLVRRALPESY